MTAGLTARVLDTKLCGITAKSISQTRLRAVPMVDTMRAVQERHVSKTLV
jgi:RNA polymerase-binding transcription factor DksA